MMKHHDQKEKWREKGLVGLYFQIVVHYKSIPGKELKEGRIPESKFDGIVKGACFFLSYLT